MRQVKINIIFYTLILLIIICSYIPKIYAIFGESCVPVPSPVSIDDYLHSQTIYGYIVNNIDMQTNVDGCKDTDSNFTFCVRGIPNIGNICTPVTLELDQSIDLQSVNDHPNFGKHPMLSNIKLSVAKIENSLCLMMPTSRGLNALLCRSYKTKSTNKTKSGDINDSNNVNNQCYSPKKACENSSWQSQSLFNFSGAAINCLRASLNTLFYVDEDCRLSLYEGIFSLNTFAYFHKFLVNSITAALIIYVILYGFKITLNKEYLSYNQITIFLVKFLFVIYFAVGIPAYKNVDTQVKYRHNGIIDYALPILLQVSALFTEFLFNSGGNQELCHFDVKRYNEGYKFYSLWDSLDCRLGYYLGHKMLYNLGNVLAKISSNTTNNQMEIGHAANFPIIDNNKNAPDTLKTDDVCSIFPILYGFFFSGNIIQLVIGVIYIAIIISMIMFFVTSYLICNVSLYTIAYISPIFVPMIMFDRTKGYFDSWLRSFLSLAIQPVIIGAFIALTLTLMDSIWYKNCRFMRHNYDVNNKKFSTFELRIPNTNPKQCKDSAGYTLMRYANGIGWNERSLILLVIYQLSDEENFLSSFIYVVFFLAMFSQILPAINTFAADITAGPGMSGIITSPSSVIQKIGKTIGQGIKKAVTLAKIAGK